MILLFKDCPDLKEFYTRRSFIKDKVGLVVENGRCWLIYKEDASFPSFQVWDVNHPPLEFSGIGEFLKENYPEVFI